MSYNLMINLNGTLVDTQQAALPITDRGVLFGDGVYEVMASYHGQIRAFDRHYQRLTKSLVAIDVPVPFSREQLLEQCTALLKANDLENQAAKIYLQVTRGESEQRTFEYDSSIQPNYFIKATACSFDSYEKMAKGYSAISHEDIRRADCHIKSICLQPSVLMKQKAIQANAEEALLYRGDYLTEGSSSNVYMVKDNIVYTPPLTRHILPGVTRSIIFDICHNLNIPIEEKTIPFQDLITADEIWVSSTTRTVKPIIKLDNQDIGSGQTGPLWHKVITSYLQQMEQMNER